jgi:hypothetical protein
MAMNIQISLPECDAMLFGRRNLLSHLQAKWYHEHGDKKVPQNRRYLSTKLHGVTS